MKKLLAIVASVCLAISLSVGLTACGGKPPQAADSVIYQTGTKSFWVGVGHAYMTFEYKAEPEQKEEGKIYGYVFNVNVDAGDGYSSWLTGTWELEENNGTYGNLTLTATWDTASKDQTSLADAESGVAKVYEPNGGKYSIGVNLPSAGTQTFTLDPVADKVGDGETPAPKPDPDDCTQHVDTNSDGKCDNCGANMPNTGEEATVMSTLKATTDGMTAKIELMSDKTWELSICYYEGGEFTKTASGTWAQNTTTWVITLNVTTDSADVLANDSYDLAINYDTQKYSADISCAIPQIGEKTFSFITSDTEKEEAKVQSTLKGTATAGQAGQIELLTDNTWKFSVKYWDGGEFTFVAGGTWEMDTTTYNIKLTPSDDPANALSEDSYTLTVDYTTLAYSVSGFVCEIPQVGALTFNLSSANAEAEHFTVTYDLNYTNAPAGGTAKTVTFDADNNVKKEYIKTAPEVPERTGYVFAGWYTVANPALTNGASKQEYLFGTKLSAFNSAPDSIKNDVMAITENTTLYARWVEVVEISTAEGLKAMANDLSGAYKLTADITLNGEWTPIGGYYGKSMNRVGGCMRSEASLTVTDIK